MTRHFARFSIVFLSGIAVATLFFAFQMHSAAQQQRRVPVKVNQIFDHPLSDIEGRKVQMLRIDLPPGSGSPAHAHSGHSFVYVSKGAIVHSMNQDEPKEYQKGEVWYEAPYDTHATFRNASDTEPAEAIVFFVIKEGAPQTVLPGAKPKTQ